MLLILACSCSHFHSLNVLRSDLLSLSYLLVWLAYLVKSPFRGNCTDKWSFLRNRLQAWTCCLSSCTFKVFELPLFIHNLYCMRRSLQSDLLSSTLHHAWSDLFSNHWIQCDSIHKYCVQRTLLWVKYRFEDELFFMLSTLACSYSHFHS